MQAFLFGAGASRGTFNFGDFPLPVAAEFGATLARLDPNWAKNYPALSDVVLNHLHLDRTKWPLEPVWTCVDYYAKFEGALLECKSWDGAVSRDLKRALLAVYGGRCDAQALQANDDSTIAQLLRNEMKAGDTLISFNYDTIVERIACKKYGRKLRSISPIGEATASCASGDIVFAKPHGSTSWSIERNTGGTSVGWPKDGSPLLESLPENGVGAGREPLLLGTAPIKSELIKEVQEQCRSLEVFEAIATQWRAVVGATRDADCIVVVGYSFPQEDQYGRFLMQEGLRQRKRSEDIRIEFFDLEDKEAERAKELATLFRGHVRELVFRGRVKPSAA